MRCIKMDIVGVSHPIPTKFAERIYNENKTVFVGKSYLCRVKKGDKFIVYESRGARAYTGMADIISVGKMKTNAIYRKFKNELMVNKKEFDQYSSGRKEMNYIEFENFQKFKNPVKPPRFVGIRGKYIKMQELKRILRHQMKRI